VSFLYSFVVFEIFFSRAESSDLLTEICRLALFKEKSILSTVCIIVLSFLEYFKTSASLFPIFF